MLDLASQVGLSRNLRLSKERGKLEEYEGQESTVFFYMAPPCLLRC